MISWLDTRPPNYNLKCLSLLGIILGTAKGNGSQTNCAVPYKNTELVLSCDNEWGNQTDVIIGEPYWMKGGCGISGGQDLGQGINYTVNPLGRRLTNSDSAIYCCTWKSQRPELEYSYSIDVNVHGKLCCVQFISTYSFIRASCEKDENSIWYSV